MNYNFDAFGPLALFGGILGFIFALMQFLICIGLYILGAFGLYTIAKRKGIELAWLAFVPIAQFYVVALLIRRLEILEFEIPRLELVLPLAPLTLIVLRWIPYVGYLAQTAVFVLEFAALYYLFRQYRDKRTSLIYTIFAPIFLFVIKDAVPENQEATYGSSAFGQVPSVSEPETNDMATSDSANTNAPNESDQQ